MSAFDPATVRKAVDEFTPRRPEKFQDLMPAKDVIVELRQKRASYRSIQEREPDGSRRGGLVWHTQGSGKSLTMVMLAKALALSPANRGQPNYAPC